MLTEAAHDIFRWEIAMPGPLKSVNVYLIKGDNGWSVIDTGPKHPGAAKEWEKVLKTLNIPTGGIQNILVTHFHIDHMGMAGWLQQENGAAVYMSEPEYESLRAHYTHSFDISPLITALLALGLPPADAENIPVIFNAIEPLVSPLPEVTTITSPEIFLGREAWQVFTQRGHAVGHVSLYSRERNLLLSGDQVLPSITSVIMFPQDENDNPLGDYLASLDQLSALGHARVLPAHGGVIDDLLVRIEELRAHHDQRLSFIVNRLRSCKEQNVKQLVDSLWGPDLFFLNQFLAFGEITSHLLYLQARGKVLTHRTGESPERITFTAADIQP